MREIIINVVKWLCLAIILILVIMPTKAANGLSGKVLLIGLPLFAAAKTYLRQKHGAKSLKDVIMGAKIPVLFSIKNSGRSLLEVRSKCGDSEKEDRGFILSLSSFRRRCYYLWWLPRRCHRTILIAFAIITHSFAWVFTSAFLILVGVLTFGLFYNVIGEMTPQNVPVGEESSIQDQSEAQLADSQANPTTRTRSVTDRPPADFSIKNPEEPFSGVDPPFGSIQNNGRGNYEHEPTVGNYPVSNGTGFQTRLSDENIKTIYDIARDSATRRQMVPVKSYKKKSGTIVGPYERRPPGGSD